MNPIFQALRDTKEKVQTAKERKDWEDEEQEEQSRKEKNQGRGEWEMESDVIKTNKTQEKVKLYQQAEDACKSKKSWC